MSQDQKTDFVLEVGKSLPSYCSHYLTRVIATLRDGGPADHRGTALLCTIGERTAFVTANHVLTEIEKDDRFACCGLSCLPIGVSTTDYRFEDIDIAVIVPDVEVTVSSEREFWSSENSDKSNDMLAVDYLLVQGFPAAFSHFSAFLPGHSSELYTHCTSIRLRESDIPVSALDKIRELFPHYLPVPDALLKPKQFAMNYAENTGPLKTEFGETVTTKHILEDYSRLYRDGVALPGQPKSGAFGLSGSPVWRFGAVESDWQIQNWTLDNAKICGIVTDWNEGQTVLIATPFHEILSHLNAAGFS